MKLFAASVLAVALVVLGATLQRIGIVDAGLRQIGYVRAQEAVSIPESIPIEKEIPELPPIQAPVKERVTGEIILAPGLNYRPKPATPEVVEARRELKRLEECLSDLRRREEARRISGFERWKLDDRELVWLVQLARDDLRRAEGEHVPKRIPPRFNR